MATATRGLEILRGTPEADAQAQCLKVMGTCELRLGRLQEARHHFEQSLKLAPACSDLRHRPAILSSLALVQKSLGNYGEALRLSLEALEQQRGLGDVASEALSLNNLAALHIEQQEYASAGEYLKPALVLCDRHGLVTTRVYVLANLTGVAMNTGETAAAEEYARRALEHAQAIGNRFVVSYMRMQFVRFALRRGDPGAARAELRSGMELAIEVGRPALLLEGLTCLAEILAAQGETSCAHMVATFAANHPSTGPLERDVLRRYLQRLSTTAEGQAAWPGLSLDELTHRIVVESNLAYAPLIATLSGAHSPA
jgi:tetratricopeptide (TPR) repeat protein